MPKIDAGEVDFLRWSQAAEAAGVDLHAWVARELNRAADFLLAERDGDMAVVRRTMAYTKAALPQGTKNTRTRRRIIR